MRPNNWIFIYKMTAWIIPVFGCIVVACLDFSEGRATEGMKYGEGFQKLIRDTGYKGGATGVLLGNRLGYASGFGHSATGHNIHVETLLNVGAISKTITALAALKLTEDGKLNLNDKVFGSEGIMKEFKPFKQTDIDQRLYEIVVDDLLRHAGGWDSDISSMGDPIFNEHLTDDTNTIKNISKEMKLKGPLNTHDIIKYMMSHPLDFIPGTDSAVSNLGYILLGRVIETVTGVPYEEYVEKNILTPCGMWHTRLGPHNQVGQLKYKGRTTREVKAELRANHETLGEYYAYARPYSVDSCLGWFSNVYDMMRLAQCIDGSAGTRLLNATTTELLLTRPRGAVQRNDNWHGAGVQVHHHGAVWVAPEPNSPDIVFMHRNLRRHKDGDTYTGEENDPMAWVFLLEGKPNIDTPLKQLSRVMVESETHWPLTDAYTDDVADQVLTLGPTTKLIKLKIEEHRANRYLQALKQVGYNVVWINAYTHEDSTFITVVGEKNAEASKGCIAAAGLDENQLIETKLRYEKQGYNMTFFQNYKSFSHRDKYMFLAVFHKGAFKNGSHIVYGLHHFDKPYKTLLNLYEEKGYQPLVQSIEYSRDDALLSFILEADDSKTKGEIADSEEGLSESRLERYVSNYAKKQKKLIYLDASNHRGKPRFSALFKKTRMSKWLFMCRLSEEDLLSEITRKEKEGFLPSIVVGYSTKNQVLQFAIYMEKP